MVLSTLVVAKMIGGWGLLKVANSWGVVQEAAPPPQVIRGILDHSCVTSSQQGPGRYWWNEWMKEPH